MTSPLLSYWHLKSYRQRIRMNGMIFIYLKREDSIKLSSCILHWWILPEVEFTSVMTDFPSFAIEIVCGALNRLVNDVIINWHAQRGTRNVHGENVFHPFSLAKRLTCNGMSLDSWYWENIKKWCYGTWGNNQYRNLQVEVYFEAASFCIARDQRQYRKCAGYAPCSWCKNYTRSWHWPS